jgi:hypothetical protein
MNQPPNWYSQEMKEGFLAAQRRRKRKKILNRLTRPLRHMFRRRK